MLEDMKSNKKTGWEANGDIASMKIKRGWPERPSPELTISRYLVWWANATV
jgi:hypothetical protein